MRFPVRIFIYLWVLLASAYLCYRFWPRATEITDCAIIKLPPGVYGDIWFPQPTTIILKSGSYVFNDLVFMDQRDHPAILITAKTMATVENSRINVYGHGCTFFNSN